MNRLKEMEALLTEEDKFMLKSIYAPREVCVQPIDTRTTLCVLPSGELRTYGWNWDYSAEAVTLATSTYSPDLLKDVSRKNYSGDVYYSSTDCGLSWKLRQAPERCRMEACFEMSNGQFIKVHGRDKDTVAYISDIGCDDTNPQQVVIGISVDDCFPVVELSNHRVICSGHTYLAIEEDKNEHQYPVFLYSDDFGQHWKYQVLKNTPPFEVKYPHKGKRWENRGGEASVVEVKDGILVMTIRTCQDYHYMCFSYDYGDTWTDPVPSRFHATLTTPAWLKMTDGRVFYFWNNTQPLPEQDHDAQFPPCDWYTANAYGEDVFTNRDACHGAVLYPTDEFREEDFTLAGESDKWIGYREIGLNHIRNYPDFRVYGSLHESLDKSVQQFQAIELPYGKIMLQYGQNTASRRTVIFDSKWLEEKGRTEDFTHGLANVSTQVYVKSYNGCSSGHGHLGHCAYNRTNGALLVVSPEVDHREVLQLVTTDDCRLFSNIQGVVWNFPNLYSGEINIECYIKGGPLRISLSDRWFNPIDTAVSMLAPLSFMFGGEKNVWHNIKIKFDVKTGLVDVFDGEKKISHFEGITVKNGLSYLHLQNGSDEKDYEGCLIRVIKAE